MSDIVDRARVFATATHARLHPGGGAPWPFDQLLRDAADVVAATGADAELVAAAWLHDTVDETTATFDDVERAFGPRIARLVEEVSGPEWPGARPSNRARPGAALIADASSDGLTVGLAVAIATGRLVRRREPERWPAFAGALARALDAVGHRGPDTLVRQARKLAGLLEPPSRNARARPSGPGRTAMFGPGQHRVERLFVEAFVAGDVAEPLRSFDGQLPAGDASALVAPFTIDAVGVRQAGVVAGYALAAELTAGRCEDAFRPFASDQIVEADAPLSRVIDVLGRFDHCFVRTLETVVGIVHRRDMQKPLVRMWLFGIITLVEMEIARRIRDEWPDNGWASLVPAQRLARARQLQDERGRRGQPCELLDCLQLSDKAQLLMEAPGQLAAFGFEGRTAARRVVQEFESLRNNLAHAQDIVTHDWTQIVRMARRFE
ncbi:MAG: HD domain-containing protein [Acidobacteriota bacterium]|nr:HD domain-containing protein [Acidobacteriota bacterium]